MLFWSENDECKDQNLQITNKRRVRLYCDVGIKHQSINLLRCQQTGMPLWCEIDQNYHMLICRYLKGDNQNYDMLICRYLKGDNQNYHMLICRYLKGGQPELSYANL